MNPPNGFFRRYAASLVALVVVAVCLAFSRFPHLEVTARFQFDRQALPEVPNHPPHKNVRAVHPSLQRIAAWVSTLGAAVMLADLDGDGLPNDVCYVDPRTDLVTVAPVPGSPDPS